MPTMNFEEVFVSNINGLKVGDDVYDAGDEVPNAASFSTLHALIQTGRLRRREMIVREAEIQPLGSATVKKRTRKPRRSSAQD